MVGQKCTNTSTIVLVHFVYLLRCADGTPYTGSARDPQQRAQAHNAGLGARYTAGRRPVRLVYTEPHESLSDALRREYQVKRWSRAKKEMLIAGGSRQGDHRSSTDQVQSTRRS